MNYYNLDTLNLENNPRVNNGFKNTLGKSEIKGVTWNLHAQHWNPYTRTITLDVHIVSEAVDLVRTFTYTVGTEVATMGEAEMEQLLLQENELKPSTPKP